MKKYYFLIFLLLIVGTAFAQKRENLSKEEKARREKNIQVGNPFVKYGSKAPVATLSKGKYLEVQDLDSIVTIGTMRWHVDKKEIVGRVEIDTLNVDAQPTGDIPGRWMSMDPLTDEFPDKSPYSYCNNNPVRYTDPLGMAPEDNIVITGDKKEETLQQLNKGSELTFTMDNNGTVSATQNFVGPLTQADNELMNATTDSSYTASLNSTDGFKTMDGTNTYLTSLGSFDGSVQNADGTMTANQTVNPDFGARVDNHVGRQEGVGVVHETLEAVQEAKRAVATGKPADFKTNPSAASANYKPAHNAARALDPRHTDNYDNPARNGKVVIINSQGQRMTLYDENKK
ncbi:MAG: hypothetical protein QM710_14360 [Flavobacterium sp.]